MFLNEEDFLEPMKLVYQLENELKADPEQVAKTQALTMDETKPNIGLKGTYGLFGSDEWWKNIRSGKMPKQHVAGVIEKVYVTGVDESLGPNTFDMLIDDDFSTLTESIYVDSLADTNLFKVGARVEILYLLEELKARSRLSDETTFSKAVLEMAVSK